MSIDRELAYESLKWVDPKVYRLYLRLRLGELSEEEAKSDIDSLTKLYIITRMNDALEQLEAMGVIDILNDYDNERILVRLNDSYRRVVE